MAAKTQPKLERTYTIPLRREILKVPRYKRAKKAVTAVKQFLSKHMKSEDVRIGSQLNEELWKNGIKNPPTKVRVTAIKENDIVRAEKEGVKFKSLEIKKKSEVATGLKGKLQGMVQSTKEEKSEGIESLAESKEVKAVAGESLEAVNDLENDKTEDQKEEANEEVKEVLKEAHAIKPEAKDPVEAIKDELNKEETSSEIKEN